ncbi:hypothetical protein [Rhodobacter sp. NSM]|uniref:hypothetical protein n=1 Tax=Rhodobacter sp. NSM TaxID=3457501 RepID=UPI003FD6595D
MSRTAPFLIDDLLPDGVHLRAVRPVDCHRIPLATSVVAMALAEGGSEDLGARLSVLTGKVAVLVAAEGLAAGEEAVRILGERDLPGLVLVIEARAGTDWLGRLRTLARRLVPQAALPDEPQPVHEPAALRYLGKMRELEVLIDPEAAVEAPVRDDVLSDARSWHARLHARALARFLRRQGRGERLAGRPRKPAADALTALRAALDPARPIRSLGGDEMAREEALLDGLIAEEKARQAAMVRPAPWRGLRRFSGGNLGA